MTMPDTESIKLVAVERGFYAGRMIEPGKKFEFTGKKPPKWAVKPEDVKPPKKKLAVGDLKPVDAQAAVKQKTAELTGAV